MSVKKISFLVASITKLFILLFLFTINSKAEENNIKHYSKDMGILSLMYHRFNEPKYPSTNIQMDIFKNQIQIIKEKNYVFYNPGEFNFHFNEPKKIKKILITIDDGFSSFYENAWPYLKENKIPFLLFISTEAVGNFGYMTWDQIKEIESEEFAYIGNHSHTHGYLVEFSDQDFLNDIKKSINIFKKKLGYSPQFFSYPFGEYSLFIKKYIEKNFESAFGQHSGVIDLSKDRYELPRFAINEKYGDLERFKFIINLNPFPFKNLYPEDKHILTKSNPPDTIIEFFEDQKNIENISCFSDEGNKWMKSNVQFINSKKIKINFRDKFLFRIGKINCSLNDFGKWRWFGFQFSIDEFK
jgi:peptidoglycan/xylan/chitin deacetylase (PgdA/CDA1 family)